MVFPKDIIPQGFSDDTFTVLPPRDFSSESISNFPLVYQNMPNLVNMMGIISLINQNYYDILRSLTNAININSVGTSSGDAAPTQDYLKICANWFNAPYSDSDTDQTVSDSIKGRIIFVNSRGTIASFYSYYLNSGIVNFFDNEHFVESGNATLDITIPYLVGSDAYNQFDYDMFKMKAAGIKINLSSTVLSYYEFSNATNELKTDDAGFSYIDARGYRVGGGNLKTSDS